MPVTSIPNEQDLATVTRMLASQKFLTNRSSQQQQAMAVTTRRARRGHHGLWLFVVACAFLTTSFVWWCGRSSEFLLKQSLQQPYSSNLQLTSFSGAAEESIASLRTRLPPCVWSRAGSNANAGISKLVEQQLTAPEKERATRLCGKFLYSSIQRAVRVGDLGEQTFVSTGDIDDMWTRDSAVQIGLYVSRLKETPFLRPIVEGAIRRQAFNILQDPYANAYQKTWVDPSTLQLRDLVIGRGGFVSTKNYELDSGAYFLTQLYDYYVAEGLYRPQLLLAEPLIFDAVVLMVDTWIVEQHHEEQSPYRYLKLSRDGKGEPTAYTGMSWTGFRPSDDACKYGYFIPSNIFAAGALERTLVLNQRIWHSQELQRKATRLLSDIEEGIRNHGVVRAEDTGELIYAYEVDGLGNTLHDFDDANVPSLLSIPLLGWSGYDHEIYKATRARLLSEKNPWYFTGETLRGMGSPHTPRSMVWPMSLAIEALTLDGTKEEVANSFVFQLRQSLTSACNDAMHESVSSHNGCDVHFTREWFEWSNALFVVLLESALGIRCDKYGLEQARNAIVRKAAGKAGNQPIFYVNNYQNNHNQSDFYQGLEALVPHYE